ncbi:MAG: leucine-rich repeat domain-containing protein [Oscillospiraceae bacterium]
MINSEFIIQDGVLLSYLGKDTEVIIPNEVTSIGDNVFKGMFNITKVIIPDTVKTIGKFAFKGCKKLCDINFPNGLIKLDDYAFHRCHALKSVILPDTLTEIGRCVFHYCDNLEMISIKGVKRLQMQTFANDTSLKELHINKDLDTSNITDDILTGCIKISKVVLSNGDEYIIENLIDAMTSKNDIPPVIRDIAKGVYKTMSIQDGILYKFHVNLKSFELPEGITCIEKSCFYDRKGIVSITLPKSLKTIRNQAFKNCINLEEIRILNDSLLIDVDAFKGCNNLNRIVLSDGKIFNINSYLNNDTPKIVKKIQEQVQSDFYISGNTLVSYRGSEERVTVPNGITTIGESCFANNEAIGRVILPNTVTDIQEDAFKGCVSMQTISLSESLINIERSAFENCFKLLHIDLPKNVSKLGQSCFKRCLKLNTVKFNNNLQMIEDMAFYGCKSLKDFKLPQGVKIYGELVFFKSSIKYDGNPNENRKFLSIEENYSPNDIEPYKYANTDDLQSISVYEPCTIGKYAFSNCKYLTDIHLDNPNIVVENNAFEKCPNLKRVYLNVKSLGNSVLSFCRNLEDVTIFGIDRLPDETFFGCENLKTLEIPEIKTIGKRCFDECISLESFNFKNVQNIEERAFSRCESLRMVKIYQGVVGYHAFEDCVNLEDISINSDVILKSGAFFGSTNIKNITLDGLNYNVFKYSQSINCLENALPYRVQEILSSIYLCFTVNERLEITKYKGNAKSITIPIDIVSIGDETFRDCIRLQNINIPSSVKYIGKMAFVGTSWLNNLRSSRSIVTINNMLIDATTCNDYFEIPRDIIRVCGWAFANNYSLKELKILNDKTIIDEYAFRNCINLKSVTLEDGSMYTLNNIDDINVQTLPTTVRNIFKDCINCFKILGYTLIESTGNIPNLVFINGIKSIGDGVYKDCNLLESIKLSKDTTSIGNNAFENSKWLKYVENAYNVESIGNFAFSGCQSLERIELSNHLQTIGKRAFEHCCNLKEIIISEGITEIQEKTFFRCKSLKKIVLPSTLKIIHKEAFAFCTSLEEVIFPMDLETIEDRAFAWCESLRSYTISNVTMLGKDIFFNGVKKL